ncbi:MAG: DUF2254 domain-containing protein [Pacificimonas sp.]|jgi:uncharacterized membrane protein|nr:DUF2254 domain-containing protein [Pacificimonas sp.]
MSNPAEDFLTGRWRFLWNRFVKQIWFRASLFSLAAIAVALIGAFLPTYLPFPLELELAAGSVNSLLTILASSMLAVTTFSLSIMVNAYAAAATNSTPRATALLIEDSVASNTLATFLGSFLFSIVGLVGISAQIYGEQGRILLFVSTLVVLFMVTAALLRWVEQLTRFGRVGDTIKRVEQSASSVINSWARSPRLGCERRPEDYPDDCAPLHATKVGYVQHIDVEALNALAEKSGGAVHIRKGPGAFVSPDTVLALMETEPEGDGRKDMRNCFSVGAARSYDQDPAFGLVVLSEIASRALSPAVNDPGTAVQVITSGVRVFQNYCSGIEQRADPTFHHLTMDDVDHGELLEDFFAPIARDGAGLLEVQLRVQKGLEMIALAHREHFGNSAKKIAALSLKRALKELDGPLEQTRLKKSFGWDLPDAVTGERESEL